jgi:hypothetical protein
LLEAEAEAKKVILAQVSDEMVAISVAMGCWPWVLRSSGEPYEDGCGQLWARVVDDIAVRVSILVRPTSCLSGLSEGFKTFSNILEIDEGDHSTITWLSLHCNGNALKGLRQGRVPCSWNINGDRALLKRAMAEMEKLFLEKGGLWPADREL